MKTIKISLPKSWNELSDRQLQLVALLFNSEVRGNAFDAAVFHVLANTQSDIKAAFNARAILKEVPISELRKHFEFIYSTYDRTVFVKTIKAGGQVLHSPMDRLTNLSAEEFSYAEGLHATWYKEKHRNALQYLAAVLYSTSSATRPVFDKNILEEKAKLFNDVPLPELLAMELAYAGCKNAIVKRFKTAFPEHASKKSKQDNGYGFGKVILNMSGGKFGAYDLTRNTNIYTFLEEFQENLKAAKNAN